MVEHNGYKGSHTLYVVGEMARPAPPLLGRDWLGKIHIDWAGIRAITSSKNKLEVESLLSKYPQVFQPGVGTMTEVRAHLSLKPGTQPRFCRPRTVPYAIKEKVGKELDRLEEEGVLQRVNHSDWAAPIVPTRPTGGGRCTATSQPLGLGSTNSAH